MRQLPGSCPNSSSEQPAPAAGCSTITWLVSWQNHCRPIKPVSTCRTLIKLAETWFPRRVFPCKASVQYHITAAMPPSGLKHGSLKTAGSQRAQPTTNLECTFFYHLFKPFISRNLFSGGEAQDQGGVPSDQDGSWVSGGLLPFPVPSRKARPRQETRPQLRPGATGETVASPGCHQLCLSCHTYSQGASPRTGALGTFGAASPPALVTAAPGT